MIEVKYERYWNDFYRKSETKHFPSLRELEEWIFGQMQQDYTEKQFVMSFPTPKAAERISVRGPWSIEFKPVWGEETFWIHQISDGSIIFSDGKFTAGQKYWNKEVQDWLVHCDERQHHPKFNFADSDSEQSRWFAITRWCAENVVAAAEQQGVTLTPAQAQRWLEKNEKWFKDLLVEYGNEILASASRESFEEAKE